MLKYFCDKCKKEMDNNDKFRFEGIMVEIKQSLNFLNHQKQNQQIAEKKIIHLCEKCYKDNINL